MIKRIAHYAPFDSNFAALLLRLIFGGMFVYFGYLKLSNYDTMLTMMGDPIGIGKELSLQLVIFAEFFCALFVVLGFLTRFFVIPIFITMAVAYFISHAKDPFQVKHSAFSYMLFCLPVFVLGSGKYSVDRLVFHRSPMGKSK